MPDVDPRDRDDARSDPPPGRDPDRDRAPRDRDPSASPSRVYSQAELDALLDRRLNEERDRLSRSISAELSRKYGANIDALTDELPKLREFKATREREEAEAEGNYKKILESKDHEFQTKQKSWQEREAALLETVREAKVTGRLIAAAAGRAIKPEQIARLLSDRVKLDPTTLAVTVLDEDGEPWYKGGRGATIEELVESFLTAEPHLAVAPATMTRGSGAHGSTSGADTGEGGAGGEDDAELVRLTKQLEKAEEAARKSGSDVDIMEAHRIAREIKVLKLKLKTPA